MNHRVVRSRLAHFFRKPDDYSDRLDILLGTVDKAGLKLQAKKCKFASSSTVYLRDPLSAEGIAPDPEKVRTICELPPPRSVNEVRCFLGMASYYHRFIGDYAMNRGPLVALTRKAARWSRSKEEETSFSARSSGFALLVAQYGNVRKGLRRTVSFGVWTI